MCGVGAGVHAHTQLDTVGLIEDCPPTVESCCGLLLRECMLSAAVFGVFEHEEQRQAAVSIGPAVTEGACLCVNEWAHWWCV